MCSSDLPSDALVVTQDGASVFLAKDDNTVEIRKLTTGRKIADMTVIESGLKPGEKVVDSAQIKLFPGAAIKIVTKAVYDAGPAAQSGAAQGAGSKEKDAGKKDAKAEQGQGS